MNSTCNTFEPLDFTKTDWSGLRDSIKFVNWKALLHECIPSNTSQLLFTLGNLCSIHVLAKHPKKNSSISHAASDTTGIRSTFHLQWGSSGCQKWHMLSELNPSISDSSCSSKMRSTISIKSVLQIIKVLYTSICLSIHN